jgi:TetR/AcrR family transcriptional repressor of nem operon
MKQVQDTRQRLLDTAQRLFYARSYEDVGVQEICQEAGVKKGSFYHFFPSKRDLTVAVLQESWQQFRDTVLADVFAPQAAPLERVERLLDMHYRHQRALKDQTGQVLGCPYGNLAGEMSTQDEVIREHLLRIFRDLEAPLEAALEEAVEAGDLAEQDCRATASAMVAYLEGLTLMAKTRNDPEVLRQLGPAMLKLAYPLREG